MESSSLQKFVEEIQSAVEDKVQKWWDIVTNMMGTKSDWNDIFLNQINELCDEMISEALARRDTMLNKIDTLLKRSSVLCKTLNIKMPDYGVKGLTLLEEQEFLMSKVKEYEETIDSLQQDIKQLNKLETSLTISLGIAQNQLPLLPLPSKESIDAFKVRLEQLESKKFEREEYFLNTKAEICELVNELKYKPSLDFERMVISPNDSLFLVTDNNMHKLNEFLRSLQQQREDVKERVFNLQDKLKSLWELLNEDIIFRDSFLKKHEGNNLETLEAFQEEVNRCENLKKSNIEVFVQRLRTELQSMWNKCHFSDKDRSEFVYFNSDTYSEDLLSIHDLEITRMKEYYSANCDLIKLLEKWEEIWSRMLELDESAMMPNRYRNRGGQLLKEEKERNGLAKRLPKIEEQLLYLADSFVRKHGKPFYSWGRTVNEIIEEAHNAHEEDKKLRSSARKQKRDPTPSRIMGMTSSVSTQNLVLITPKSGVKRKLLTPSENIPKTAPSKLNGKTFQRSKYSIEKAKRIEKCRRISQRMLQKKLLGKENTSTDYVVFEQEISNKDGCRSTLFQGPQETALAVPLPVTPNPKHLSSSKKRKVDTPEGIKLSTAPSLRMMF